MLLLDLILFTSLKALDEGYSSKNYVRKFLRALHHKIEELKDLTSLSLDELIGNLKVHEMIIKKDSKIVKAKVERKSLALKAKEKSSDEECSTSRSEDKEYAMVMRRPESSYWRMSEATKRRTKNLLSEVLDSSEEDDEKVKNEMCLVAQASSEGIDYDETYALVARLESIRILLAYACALDFKLFQMDVKSAFLNGFINEEVYVAQPPEFTDFEKPAHVYKLKKASYGLKQASKAWYDRLKSFLIKHEYKIRMVDNILFTKKKGSNIIIVQIYVNDIIFVSTCQDMCDEFAKIMHDEFKMSMMGELNFFLRLQIKQMEDGIFFNKSKYIKEMLKKYGLEESKPMKTPMSFDTKLTKDEECESVDSTKYRGMIVYADSDHAGDYVNRKSTSGICTFVGCCLTSWLSKKQTALAISTTKAEYVSIEKACQQAPWMKQALIDYDVRLDDILHKFLTYLARVLASSLTKWSLNELAYGVPTDGPYQTNPPSPDDNISSIRIDREGQVSHIRHKGEIDVHEYQIPTREILTTFKPLEEIIWENVFCLGLDAFELGLFNLRLITTYTGYRSKDSEMETDEISERYIAPCFVNGLEPFDGEVNLAFDENLISNEFAVKLCLDYEVKKGKKFVKKELIVTLKGKLYFVKFIINPKEDDFEHGVILERSFLRLANGVIDFSNKLLDFNFDDVPKSRGELPLFVCKIRKSIRNKKRSMENLNLLYQDIGPSSSAGRHLTQEEAKKEALAIMISKRYALLEEESHTVKEDKEAVRRIKGEALNEKDDHGAFIFPIRLEGKVNDNALADTGSDINTMPYRIFKTLGREDMKKIDRGITMINHT
nr:retrovirus-related Pol polyprotein from transposon TNT 1-94 [Tanacetum cinerariifolium]